jgi:hypothetical protein
LLGQEAVIVIEEGFDMTQTRLVARTTITAPAKISVALNVNGRQRQLKLAIAS